MSASTPTTTSTDADEKQDVGTVQFGPSKLGTKAHWDDMYQVELAQFEERGDPGEIWFGEDVAEKMVDWIVDHEDLVPKDARICDVGCGNGHLLVELHKAGYTPNLLGTDYSELAVSLASSYATSRDAAAVKFQVSDLLQPETQPADAFDVILDKGTFDAICLHEANHAADTALPWKLYLRSVVRSLRQGGVLLITSVNWTLDELKKMFAEGNRSIRF